MIERKSKLREQAEDLQNPNDASTLSGTEGDSTGSGGRVPSEKFQAFKDTMAKMFQASTQVGTANTAPAKAAGQAQPPRQPGETKAGGAPIGSQALGSRPGARNQPLQQQLTQSVENPAATQGFVELKGDASDAALTHLAKQLGVEEDRLKKLSTTRGVRLLISPDYLKVR